MTTPNGTTTSSRAGANGTVTGSITETAFFYTTYAVDPIDMMRLIISNDTGSLQQAFFGTSANYKGVYNNMGAAYSSVNGCNMSHTMGGVVTACSMVFDVVVTSGYTNNSGVSECQPVISYGGGDCDPDANGQAVFEAINTMRLNTATWAKYITENDGAALVTFPNNYQMSGKLTNAAVSSNTDVTQSITRGKSNVADTATALTNAAGTLE